MIEIRTSTASSANPKFQERARKRGETNTQWLGRALGDADPGGDGGPAGRSGRRGLSIADRAVAREAGSVAEFLVARGAARGRRAGRATGDCTRSAWSRRADSARWRCATGFSKGRLGLTTIRRGIRTLRAFGFRRARISARRWRARSSHSRCSGAWWISGRTSWIGWRSCGEWRPPGIRCWRTRGYRRLSLSRLFSRSPAWN